MGLDSLELVLELEASFQVPIPDEVARELATPRHVISYFRTQLPRGEATSCLAQRAFFRLRTSTIARTTQSRGAVRPSTLTTSVFGPTATDAWSAVGRDLGVRRWPASPSERTLWARIRGAESPQSFGALARRIADENPALLKGQDGWTDAEIERIVVLITERELGVDMSRYTLDARYVADLGAY